ncbi:MAG: SDR family oxidoreductase, partial [Saprospiraceae bacterium]|nr:SDR family oxidoreductase [Saprospiraceae bacterium]NNE26076.1 SDR family oxidoreductase [Saprospiraceae bacterium]
MNTHIDLHNTSILVTGASQGIGKAIANYTMSMGARVAVHYNTHRQGAETLVEQYPATNSKAFKADLSHISEVIDFFKAVNVEFGQIDVIILNAGVFIPHSTFEEVDEWFKIWKKTLAINLDAVGILTKLGIDHFREHGGGRFIYMGSRAVFRGETEEYLAYAASKGGMTSLARSVARSFGKDNIKAFT